MLRGLVLYTQRYNAAGSAQGKPLNVVTMTIANDQASLAMDRDGDFVVTWIGNFQRVDRFGVKQGPIVTIPDAIRTTAGMDAVGNFVVAWDAPSQPHDMRARIYKADGTPRGDSFSVDASCPFGYPVVAMAPSGAFAISWVSSVGAYHDVWVRRFDANGVGDQTVVANLTTTGYPPGISWPSVTMANGVLAVVWSGPGPGDGDGVFGRLYAYPDGAALQAEGGAKALSGAVVLPGVAPQPLLVDAAGRKQRALLPDDAGARLLDAALPLGDPNSGSIGLNSSLAIGLDDSRIALGERETPDAIDALFSLPPPAFLLNVGAW